MKKQPWIYSAGVDGFFILAPALAVTAAILCLRHSIARLDAIPPWLWAALIVGVDVAHVYSTLFRTYADKEEFRARQTLYTLVPLACWVVGTLLYSVDSLWFWRAIAYLAVFHFMRQQYGFMMIYGRRERDHRAGFRLLDKAAIYMATLYPLIYWHTHLPRHFDWFIEGDFVAVHAPWLNDLSLALYALIMVAYVAKECWLAVAARSVNIPRNALLLGTAVSWWVGIIAFDNDLAFTAANVLAHGIPYMALIWMYGRNLGARDPEKKLLGGIAFRRFFSLRFLPLFLGLLVLLAYLEEGLWDGMIWNDHKTLFAPFHVLSTVDGKSTLAWLVPLLALPQTTHYALDAFIWRLKSGGAEWKRVLFYRSEQTA
jgi:hypothetical protein